MEVIKEIWTTLSSRIVSPIRGSILFTFILFNWKPLFVLLFSEWDVEDKFIYFDKYTDLQTLLICPLIVGTVLTLVFPYINYVATIPIAPAIRLKRHHQITEQGKLLQTKHEYAVKEQEYQNLLIEIAKAQEAGLASIQDDDLRVKTQAQIATMQNIGGIGKVQGFGPYKWVSEKSQRNSVFRITGLSTTEDTIVHVAFANSNAGDAFNKTVTTTITATDVVNGEYVFTSRNFLNVINPGYNRADISFSFESDKILDVVRMDVTHDGSNYDFNDT